MIQPTNAQQLYPQKGGANAVNINIYNPQAYGSDVQAPAYPNAIYNLPQASAYAPQMDPQAQYYQQYMPTQNPIAALPAPAPQMMPDSVLEKAPVELNNEIPEDKKVDTDAIIADLKGTDADKKAGAIDKIAEYVQSEPDVALQVVAEPVMQALVDVINEDTTGLEGPTDKQIEISQKVAKGEELTPEENAISEQLSPRDMANKNRIFALYALAMIQKLQRDELDQYIETQKANGQETIEPLKVQDLIGYNDIVNVIKNDQRPEVKVAAIQALKHVERPQDEAAVKEVLADALNSDDEAIKSAAQEAVDALAA